MSKSDKELAVELTIALINANPRTTYSVNENIEKVKDALSLSAVDNILKSTYNSIKNLSTEE